MITLITFDVGVPPIASDDAIMFPECGLHPQDQALLADSYIKMNSEMNSDITIITYSEHILDRLRYHVVSDTINKDSIIIEFVCLEHTKLITINRYGDLDEWHDGFFDESYRQSERILREAIKKRDLEKHGE